MKTRCVSFPKRLVSMWILCGWPSHSWSIIIHHSSSIDVNYVCVGQRRGVVQCMYACLPATFTIVWNDSNLPTIPSSYRTATTHVVVVVVATRSIFAKSKRPWYDRSLLLLAGDFLDAVTAAGCSWKDRTDDDWLSFSLSLSTTTSVVAAVICDTCVPWSSRYSSGSCSTDNEGSDVSISVSTIPRPDTR